jgi:hypothetical protein
MDDQKVMNEITEEQMAKAIADAKVAAEEEQALMDSMMAEEQAAKDAKAAEVQAAAEAAAKAQADKEAAEAAAKAQADKEAAEAAAKAQAATETQVDPFVAMIEAIKASDDKNKKTLVFALEKYTTDMGLSNIHTPQSGIVHQKTLWLTIKHVLTSLPREEFRFAWNLVLAFVHQHSNQSFNPRYVYRFAHMWDGAKAELAAFHGILDLMIMTADSATRDIKFKQVNFDTAINNEYITDEGRSRLISFYQ